MMSMFGNYNLEVYAPCEEPLVPPALYIYN